MWCCGLLNANTTNKQSRLADLKVAADVYDRAVNAFVRAGTTTAAYYATIDWRSSRVLAETCIRYGQRAFVGKVCMDRNSPPTYVEKDTATSLADTEKFVDAVLSLRSPLVAPIITPRFVPTCTSELMKGLSELSNRSHKHSTHHHTHTTTDGKDQQKSDSGKLMIQSHLNENRAEIDWVKSLHPECKSYTDVYAKHGLLNSRTIMAHCIHMTEDELAQISAAGAGIAHCPDSNLNIKSGIADMRKYLEYGNGAGLKVGLGTDIGAGVSLSMLVAQREAVKASNALKPVSGGGSAMACDRDKSQPIDHRDAFYLATLGSAQVLNLDHRIGNFAVGKEFDALQIDLKANDSVVDVFDTDSVNDRVQKFLFQADDRNITNVFVAGRLIHSRPQTAASVAPRSRL